MSKMSPNHPNRPFFLWKPISLSSANRPMPHWIEDKNQLVAERRIEFLAGSGEGIATAGMLWKVHPDLCVLDREPERCT